MLRLAAIAVVGVLSAAASAEAVMSLDHAQRAQDTPVAAAPLQPTADLAQASPASGEVVKGADGHYWAEGDVNGQAVHFLVDTGATAVTLTAADAQRLGVTPASLSYDLKMTTANGDSRAARIKLTSVTVGGARLDNVDAVVVENGLHTSLLGMSYLGRLSRFEATPSALILQP